MAFHLEVGARTVEDMLAAAGGGADRVELYVSPTEGALTPSAGLVAAADRARRDAGLAIELFVMIRPRAGDMLYSDSEFDTMRRDLEILRDAGADGFMAGVLTAEGALDVPRMKDLVARAGGRPFTLHRAFDGARDPFRTLEEAVELGIGHILTGGFTADGGYDMARLAGLAEKAAGRLRVMAAFGPAFRTPELPGLLDTPGVFDYHIINGYRRRPTGMRFIPGVGVSDDDHLRQGAESVDYLDESAVREIRDLMDRHAKEKHR